MGWLVKGDYFCFLYKTSITWAKVHILADSHPKGEQKTWEKLLYIMDSTTITLFDNTLKDVGRHPKSGKKKGGMKVRSYGDEVPRWCSHGRTADLCHYA